MQRECDRERADVVRLLMKLIVGGEWAAGRGVQQLNVLQLPAHSSARGQAVINEHACLRGSSVRQAALVAVAACSCHLQWPASRSCRRWRSRRRTCTAATMSRPGVCLGVFGYAEAPHQAAGMLCCIASLAWAAVATSLPLLELPLVAPLQPTLRSRPTPASARPASWRPWPPPCSTCCSTASQRRRQRAAL